MTNRFISRGFQGRKRDAGQATRLPPGQYLTPDFPVLSAGPTPRVPLNRWSFGIEGLVGMPARWTWDEFTALPAKQFVVDIHCVTKWSKLDTHWEGVSLATRLEVVGGQAFVAYRYDGQPLAPEHGGPARLVVPHLYFWKSAKWVRGLRPVERDEPGFWESLGYNNHGDPWREERYSGD